MSYALAVQVQPRSVNQTPLPSGTFATDHASSDQTWSDDESHEVAFTAGNPRVEHITGVVHLYRDSPSSAQDSLTGFPALLVPALALIPLLYLSQFIPPLIAQASHCISINNVHVA